MVALAIVNAVLVHLHVQMYEWVRNVVEIKLGDFVQGMREALLLMTGLLLVSPHGTFRRTKLSLAATYLYISVMLEHP